MKCKMGETFTLPNELHIEHTMDNAVLVYSLDGTTFIKLLSARSLLEILPRYSECLQGCFYTFQVLVSICSIMQCKFVLISTYILSFLLLFLRQHFPLLTACTTTHTHLNAAS